MTDTTINHCTQCPNQCPITDLKCGRGRKYFSQLGLLAEDSHEHGHEQGHEEEHRHEHGHGEEHKHEHGHGEERRHEHGHGEKHRQEHSHGEERRHEHDHGEERRCEHGHEEKTDLYSMLRACGHYLFHRFGKNMGQGRILMILAKQGSITQKELQDMLRIQPGSVTEILTKMEEKGLIKRKKDEEDKRRCILELTEEGRKEFEIRKHQEEEKVQLFASLDEAEQEELKRLLGKLLTDWE